MMEVKTRERHERKATTILNNEKKKENKDKEDKDDKGEEILKGERQERGKDNREP